MLYLYLIGNPSVPITGAYRISVRKMCNDTCLTREQVCGALEVLECAMSWIRYDKESGWLWVVGYIQRQFKNVPNGSVARAFVNAFDSLLKSDFPQVVDYQQRNSHMRHVCDTRAASYRGRSRSRSTLKSKKDTEQIREEIREEPESVVKPEKKNPFDEVWSLYPDKSGKVHAKTAYDKAVKAGANHEDVVSGVLRYKQYVVTRRKTDFADLKYKQGGTWFHQRGWEDEYTVESAAPSPEIAAKQRKIVRLKAQIAELTETHRLRESDAIDRCPIEYNKAVVLTNELRQLAKDGG